MLFVAAAICYDHVTSVFRSSVGHRLGCIGSLFPVRWPGEHTRPVQINPSTHSMIISSFSILYSLLNYI